MAYRSSIRGGISAGLLVIAFVGFVRLSAAPASAGRPGEEGKALPSRQGQKAPDWVTKGPAAFPELRGKYLFGSSRIEGVTDAGRDKAKADCILRAQDAVMETLESFTRGILNEYAKAAVSKPIDDLRFVDLLYGCSEKTGRILDVEGGRAETFFDETTRVMHAILIVDACSEDELLMYAVFLGFHEELEPLRVSHGLKLEGKAASGLLFDILKAEARKIGLDCWEKKRAEDRRVRGPARVSRPA